MHLTPAQLATLKSAILAETDAAFVANRNAFATEGMAGFYNVASTFIVWKTSLPEADAVGSVSAAGTSWSWPSFIARTAGEQTGWARMFAAGFVNPSLANVRQGFADIFSGTANNAAAQRAHLTSIAQRAALRGERLFATGTGTTAAPGFLGVEGTIDGGDVVQALNS